MNVPCITFESGKESLLYCVDNEMVRHVRNQQDLISQLDDLVNRKPSNKVNLENVTGAYIENLNKVFFS
jgi:hypothetical protein